METEVEPQAVEREVGAEGVRRGPADGLTDVRGECGHDLLAE